MLYCITRRRRRRKLVHDSHLLQLYPSWLIARGCLMKNSVWLSNGGFWLHIVENHRWNLGFFERGHYELREKKQPLLGHWFTNPKHFGFQTMRSYIWLDDIGDGQSHIYDNHKLVFFFYPALDLEKYIYVMNFQSGQGVGVLDMLACRGHLYYSLVTNN